MIQGKRISFVGNEWAATAAADTNRMEKNESAENVGEKKYNWLVLFVLIN